MPRKKALLGQPEEVRCSGQMGQRMTTAGDSAGGGWAGEDKGNGSTETKATKPFLESSSLILQVEEPRLGKVDRQVCGQAELRP